MVWLALCLLLQLDLILTQAPPTATYYNAPVLDGYGTFYTCWEPGAGCGYDASIPAGMSLVKYTTGISSVSYANGQVCGMCVNITNVTALYYPYNDPYPATPFIAMITNLGPTPGHTHLLDFSSPGVPVSGGWDLTWQAIDCPLDTPGSPIQYQVNKGSQEYYLQLIPQRTLRTIVQMCILTATNGWQPMARAGGCSGLWAASGNVLPTSTTTVKLISVDGQIIQDSFSLDLTACTTADQTITGSAQFAPLTASELPLTANAVTDCSLAATTGPAGGIGGVGPSPPTVKGVPTPKPNTNHAPTIALGPTLGLCVIGVLSFY